MDTMLTRFEKMQSLLREVSDVAAAEVSERIMRGAFDESSRMAHAQLRYKIGQLQMQVDMFEESFIK